MPDPLRLAIIGIDHPHGAGWRDFLPMLESAVQVTAIVPAFQGGLTSLEERYATVPRYDSVASLLDDGAFDGALVCLPNNETPQVLEVLSGAGKHLFVEKPCARDVASLRSAAATISSANVAFQNGYAWRYDPLAERLQAMIQDGRFGKLIAIQMTQYTSDIRRRGPDHYLFDQAISGHGFFNWLGCHWLDLIPYLTGQEIVSVQARVGNYGVTPCAVEDGGTIILELASGTLVTLTGGYWLPRWAGVLQHTFLGSERWVQWEPNFPQSGGRLVIHGPQPQFQAMEEAFVQPHDPMPGYCGARGLAMWQDWIAMARGEIPSCRNTVESTLATLAVLDAVYQASATGNRVPVPLPGL